MAQLLGIKSVTDHEVAPVLHERPCLTITTLTATQRVC